jgi:hypothetical protein
MRIQWGAGANQRHNNRRNFRIFCVSADCSETVLRQRWLFPLSPVFFQRREEPSREIRFRFRFLFLLGGGPQAPFHLSLLRPSFRAYEYLRRGGSVFHLQEVLGHSTLEMTRRYANLVTATYRRCMSAFRCCRCAHNELLPPPSPGICSVLCWTSH